MEAIKRTLEEEREISNLNALRLKSAYHFRRHYLINSKGDLFLTMDLLIRLNNIITGAHNIHLRIHNVRPAGYRCIHYMTFDKIEAVLYGLVDNFSDRRITHREFARIFLDQIHAFADGNGRTCKIFFADKFSSAT